MPLNTRTTIQEPTRPVLRWHGGKWKLAPWIIGHFPPHRVYVEPFGGAASVLLRKAPAHAEVYNDLDGEVVNLFTVLRDVALAADLIGRLRLTPFARDEFALAYEESDEPVERARRLIMRSFMGIGAVSNAFGSKATGFRSNTTRSTSAPYSPIPAHDWQTYPPALERVVERLRGVVIESREASALIDQHDGPDTLFYLDPPYLPETRSKTSRRGGTGFVAYAHELSREDHDALLAKLCCIQGMAIISGYPDDGYDAALTDWSRHEKQTRADGALARTEVIWINPQASAALASKASTNSLFADFGTH